MSFKLKFKLKQHTPIIHFQHDQAGATIRASELKPKLDKFLISKLEGINIGSDKTNFIRKYKHLLVGAGEHIALNYKIKVEVIAALTPRDGNSLKKFEGIRNDRNTGEQKPKMKYGEIKRDEEGAIIWERFGFPSFFGNMDKESSRKELKFCDTIEVTFFSFQSRIIELIKINFAEFLQQTNFGTRQGKGFGSFYLSVDDPYYIQQINSPYRFQIDVSKRNTVYEKMEDLFEGIDYLYRTIRSGINLKGRGGVDKIYFKSLMFMYAKNQNPPLQWDKKTIRDTFYANEDSYKKSKENRTDSNGSFLFKADNKNFLYRDLLGLSSEQEWMNYWDIVSKEDQKSEQVGNKQVPVIQRFKSPIVFKPILRPNGNVFDVYIFIDQIPEEYKASTFVIKSKKNPKKSFPLKIWKRFDLRNYLSFCFEEIFSKNGRFDESLFKDHVDCTDSKDSIYNKLMSIYQSISPNSQ